MTVKIFYKYDAHESFTEKETKNITPREARKIIDDYNDRINEFAALFIMTES